MQTDYITSDILFLDWLGGRKSSPKQPYHIKVEHKARCSLGRKMKQKFLSTGNCHVKPPVMAFKDMGTSACNFTTEFGSDFNIHLSLKQCIWFFGDLVSFAT